MRIVLISLMVVLFSSNSYSGTGYGKSLVYGCLGGATTTGVAAYMIAPEPSGNQVANGLLFGGVGCLVGAGLSYLFYKGDPERHRLQKRIDREEEKKRLTSYDIDFGASQIKADLKFNMKSSYRQSTTNLPSDLRMVFPSPYINVYDLEDRIIKSGKKTILMRGCQAVVQTLDDPTVKGE